MAELKRPQLVLDSLQSDGKSLTHDTITVTTTATMGLGSILDNAGVEILGSALTADNAVYVIDDHSLAEAEVGVSATVSAVAGNDTGLNWVVFREEELKAAGVPLTGPQLDTFGKKTQSYKEV